MYRLFVIFVVVIIVENARDKLNLRYVSFFFVFNGDIISRESKSLVLLDTCRARRNSKTMTSLQITSRRTIQTRRKSHNDEIYIFVEHIEQAFHRDLPRISFFFYIVIIRQRRIVTLGETRRKRDLY